MAWVKLDDNFSDNRKIRRAWRLHEGAVALYVMALSYVARNELDGEVDAHWIEERVPNKRRRTALCMALIECKLFEQVDDGAYIIHDYLDFNPSHAELETRREKDRVRKVSARTPGGSPPDSTDDPQGHASDSRQPRTRGRKPVGAGSGRVEQQESSQGDEGVDARELDSARERLVQVRQIFDEWLRATERDDERTKFSADRRRRIERALASHGLQDCLAAVRNIGRDSWARGANDRGRRFDDVEHALGSAERVERWRDWKPAGQPLSGRAALKAKDAEVLGRVMGAGA